MSIENCSGKVTVQHVTSHFISRCTLLSSGAPGWIRRRTSQIRCHRWLWRSGKEQLERAEKGQGWAQPWIMKAHLVKSQMLNDLKSGCCPLRGLSVCLVEHIDIL